METRVSVSDVTWLWVDPSAGRSVVALWILWPAWSWSAGTVAPLVIDYWNNKTTKLDIINSFCSLKCIQTYHLWTVNLLCKTSFIHSIVTKSNWKSFSSSRTFRTSDILKIISFRFHGFLDVTFVLNHFLYQWNSIFHEIFFQNVLKK